MNNSLTIRRANLDDLDLIYNLEQANFSDAYSLDLIRSDLLNKDRVYVWLAYLNNKLIGYVYQSIVLDESEILRIAIQKECRGCGLGFQVLQQIINDTKKDLTKCYLEVSNNNATAIKLYQKLGFKNIYIRKNYYNNGDDAIVMELNF